MNLAKNPGLDSRRVLGSGFWAGSGFWGCDPTSKFCKFLNNETAGVPYIDRSAAAHLVPARVHKGEDSPLERAQEELAGEDRVVELGDGLQTE